MKRRTSQLEMMRSKPVERRRTIYLEMRRKMTSNLATKRKII